MSEQKREEQPITPENATAITSIGELLSSIALIANLTEKRATDLLAEGDDLGYEKFMMARAQLIVALPDFLGAFQAYGGTVPAEVSEFAEGLSARAQQAINDDNQFGMAALLEPWGTDEGEPNILEALATRYQNPNPFD